MDSSSVFNCDQCELETNSENYLIIHKESTHNNSVRFKCDVCEYVAFRKQSVDIHQKTKHKELNCKIGTIGCQKCDDGNEHTQCRFGASNNKSIHRRKRKQGNYKQDFHRKIKKKYKEIVN